MSGVQLLGLLAGAFFGFAAVPQALQTLRARRHLGTPRSIIWSVFGGTITMYTYLLIVHGWDWVLAVVYGVEALSWLVLLVFELVPE